MTYYIPQDKPTKKYHFLPFYFFRFSRAQECIHIDNMMIVPFLFFYRKKKTKNTTAVYITCKSTASVLNISYCMVRVYKRRYIIIYKMLPLPCYIEKYNRAFETDRHKFKQFKDEYVFGVILKHCAVYNT